MSSQQEFGKVSIEDPKALSVARVIRELAVNPHNHLDPIEQGRLRAAQEAAMQALTRAGAELALPSGAITAGSVRPASAVDYEVSIAQIAGLKGRRVNP